MKLKLWKDCFSEFEIGKILICSLAIKARSNEKIWFCFFIELFQLNSRYIQSIWKFYSRL